ncbi:MAG: DMT family transporter [Planctomycetota bacterium]|jgi:drug/metabolite transporter (DMT)-like permease
MNKNNLKYEFLLLLMSALWGSTFVAQQIGMERGLGPMTFNALRFALGCLSLIPVMRWWDRRAPAPAEHRFPLRGSLVAGLFLFAAAGFQQVGLLYTSSANAGFITGLYMVLVPIGGLWLGHRAGRSLWVGVALAVAGLYLLSITDELSMGRGDLLCLICAFLWTGQILVIDRIAKHGRPIRIAFLQYVVCALLSGIGALLFETASWSAVAAGAGAVAYAGILSVGVAFTLQIICQKHCPPGPTALIMGLEAVFAAITGYLVLDQGLTPRALVGCILIFCAILTVNLVPIVMRRVEHDRRRRLTVDATTIDQGEG